MSRNRSGHQTGTEHQQMLVWCKEVIYSHSDKHYDPGNEETQQESAKTFDRAAIFSNLIWGLRVYDQKNAKWLWKGTPRLYCWVLFRSCWVWMECVLCLLNDAFKLLFSQLKRQPWTVCCCIFWIKKSIIMNNLTEWRQCLVSIYLVV